MKNLEEWKDKDLQVGDKENVKKAIDDARNSAMKIGQSMAQGGSSSSSSSSESSSENKDEEKKNREWRWNMYIFDFIYIKLFTFISFF